VYLERWRILDGGPSSPPKTSGSKEKKC